jgi:hypothetical protein
MPHLRLQTVCAHSLISTENPFSHRVETGALPAQIVERARTRCEIRTRETGGARQGGRVADKARSAEMHRDARAANHV